MSFKDTTKYLRSYTRSIYILNLFSSTDYFALGNFTTINQIWRFKLKVRVLGRARGFGVVTHVGSPKHLGD